MLDPALPDNPNSKISACVENVAKIWAQTKDRKSTQLIFSDLGTPKKGAKNSHIFDAYADMRAKLISKGIPAKEIAFIHDADTDQKKKVLFQKVRDGEVHVLIGSTQKMGTGMNVQDKLIALHDLDIPYRPSDLEQRRGRAVRQGNENKQVQIYRYLTRGSFDSYLYQMLERKQRFISQVMTSRAPLRTCEDVDEVTLSFAEIKGLCAGDDRIREKMQLEVEVQRLEMARRNYFNERDYMANSLRQNPKKIVQCVGKIEFLQKILGRVEPSDSPATVNGKSYEKLAEAGAALQDVFDKKLPPLPRDSLMPGEELTVGSYRGFDVSLYRAGVEKRLRLTWADTEEVHAYQRTVQISDSATGLFTSVNNAIANIPSEIEDLKTQVESLRKSQEALRNELEKPFALEDEYQMKTERLEELTRELTMPETGREQQHENDLDATADNGAEQSRDDGYSL